MPPPPSVQEEREDWSSDESDSHAEGQREISGSPHGHGSGASGGPRIALEIHNKKLPLAETIQLWFEKTGLKQAAYYAALHRLK
jgi:hypothetical protein